MSDMSEASVFPWSRRAEHQDASTVSPFAATA